MTNRTWSVGLGLVAAAMLAACGGGGSAPEPGPAEPPASEAETTGGNVRETANEVAETVEDTVEETVDDALQNADAAIEQIDDAVDNAVDEVTNDVTDAVAGTIDTVEGAIAAGPAAVPADDGDPCTLSVTVGDSIAFSTDALSVPSSCGEVTVTLTHTGNLPAVAMGHNWVLLPEDAVEAVSMAGMGAGIDADYLPADDERIVAATKIIGGGESTSTSFALDALDGGTNYVFVCTFPGHWSIMKGSFEVT